MLSRLRSRGGSSGQAIILIALAMPIFLAMGGFVIEGGHMFVAKRHLQNVADAASLAAARELPGNGAACSSTPACPVNVLKQIKDYSSYNNYTLTPPLHFHACDPLDAADTNCYQTPFKGSNDLIQVRVRETLPPIFANALGLGPFKISAYAVASAAAQTTVSSDPGYTIPDSTSTTTFPSSTTVIITPDGTTTVITPGGTSTSTTPPTTTYSTSTGIETVPGNGSGGLMFAMSTACPAITYAGAGSQGTGSIGSLETNGGILITGATKTVDYLAWGKRGTSGCDQIGANATVKQRLGPYSPRPWPIPPPSPAPPAGCKNTDVGNISSATWKTSHPPGIYCYDGALTLSANGLSLAGYTWYAPSITVNSKGMTLSPASGQTTLLDAYSGDLTLNGSNDNVSGDMFAPLGQANIAGGALAAGSGFFEAQTISITGNFSQYTGTGGFGGATTTTVTTTTPVTIPGTTTVTTLPDSTSTSTTTGGTSTSVTPGGTTVTTIPGVTQPGSTTTITTGTTVGLNE
ncbi:MAG: TadE/TadG family type IV pilus assembly protein [Gaiellaceae bacterium]